MMYKTEHEIAQLNKAFTELVNERVIDKYDWSLWLTITFRCPQLSDELYNLKRNAMFSSEYAERLFTYFFSNVNQRFQPQGKRCRQYYQKYLYAFIISERNPFRPGIHLHGLITDVDPRLKDCLCKDCNRFFGNTKILNVHEGIAAYIGEKYGREALVNLKGPFKINSKYRKPLLTPKEAKK